MIPDDGPLLRNIQVYIHIDDFDNSHWYRLDSLEIELHLMESIDDNNNLHNN